MRQLNDIPDALGKKTVLKTAFDTSDIIKAITLTQKRFEKYQDDFCAWVKDNFRPTKDSLRQLWRAVRYGIKYEIDPAGVQHVKTPLALVEIGKGDCKSKTVFINIALDCLGIPYTTRFASYNKKDSTVKHVYSVAHLNGEDIIIDAVYYYFNREKRYHYKQDYPMGELAIIEGIEQRQVPALQTGPGATQARTYPCGPDEQKERYLAAKSNMLAMREEIRQKKAYVPTFQNVDFHKMTEGRASLALLERELKIISVMRPELAPECQKGLNMVYKASKEGVYTITGPISPFLIRYAQEIQTARTKIRPANSYGILTKVIQANKAKQARGCAPNHRVGNTGNSKCLEFLWSELQPGTTDVFRVPAGGAQCTHTRFGVRPSVYYLLNYAHQPGNGFVSLYPRGNGQNQFGDPNFLTTATEIQAYRDALYYSYGSETPYRVSFNEYGASVHNQIQQALASGRITHQGASVGDTVEFSSQADFTAFITELNQNSGVQSNWINDTFKTDPAQDAAVGSGLYYEFADKIPTSQGLVNLNKLPASVLSKRGFQGQFINSCINFSGVSKANVQQLTRLGVLFDSGGHQPESLLNGGYQLYTSGNPQIGIEPVTSATIAIIVAIISAVATGTAQVATAVIKANQEAAKIDTSLASAANFQPPSANQMPLEQDWSGTGAGTGAGGAPKKSGSMLPWIIGGAAVAYGLSQD